jgi:hypothetical protein
VDYDLCGMETLKIEACDTGKNVNPDAASQDSRRAQLLEQASNPATSPSKLRRLASIGNPALKECLAINPNTPFAVLKRLFLKFPRAILKNPIFHYRQITEGKSLREMLSPCLKLALYIELRRSGQDDEVESILPVSDRVQWLRSGPDVAPLDAPQLAALWECLAGDPAEKVRLELVQRVPPEGLAYPFGGIFDHVQHVAQIHHVRFSFRNL